MNNLCKDIKYTCNVTQQRFLSARFLTFLLLELFVLFVHLTPFKNFSIDARYPVSPWSLVLLFSNDNFQLYVTMILIYYFSNVPFMHCSEMYQLIRTGRIRWALSKIVSIVLFAFSFMLIEFIMSFIPLLGHLELNGDWGKVIYTLCNSGAGADYNIYARYDIVALYTPLKAMFQLFITGGLLFSFMGLLMYAFSLLFSRLTAVFVTFALIFFNVVANNLIHFRVLILRISPFSWMDLNNIAIGADHTLPTWSYILTVLISFIIILSIIILVKIKTTNFQWNKED